MSSTTHNNPDRLDELMVDAATQGLSPQDQAELREALERNPSLRFEAEAYELAATAVELALCKPLTNEALPPALQDKLRVAAQRHTAALRENPGLKLAGTPASNEVDISGRGIRWTDGRAFGWYAAAAALIAVCVLLVQTPDTQVIEKVVEKDATGNAQAGPTLAERYAELANRQNTLRGAWAPHPDGDTQRFANAAGEIIWNTDQQTGYMKLTGLPVNDPTKEQYQLWIVDATREGETTDRIDGGVFDVNDAGEVIVPIDPKIVARKPAVFAITVEQPGGVVVSKGPLQVFAVPDAG
ncbi:MAG: anti-sigma factor domain-containing protein [Phycisphaeraceae bacterium]